MKNDTAKRLKLIVAIITLMLFVSFAACRSTKQNLNKPPGNADKMKGQEVDAAGGVPACDKCHTFDQAKIVASFPHHPECYACHAHQANQTSQVGQATKTLGDCGTCHVKKDQALAFNRGTGPAFSLYNFRHGPHLAKSGDCSKCHKSTDVPETPARADIAEINVVRGQRHHSACWQCHVPAREQTCTKCHKGSVPF